MLSCNMSTSKSIFMFTRDLRLEDNTTLIQALKHSECILPIFIFNPDQISDENQYKSNNCLQFMCECLDELDRNLQSLNSRLYFFHGYPEKVLESLIQQDPTITAIYITMDYTPFAKTREFKIKQLCKQYHLSFHTYEDYLLTGINKIHTSNNTCYVKFTPFLKQALEIANKIPAPDTSHATYHHKYISAKIHYSNEYKDNYHNLYTPNPNLAIHGGRSNAMKILKNLSDYQHYNQSRNFPAQNQTTKLAPFLKFNVVSIREAYYSVYSSLGMSSSLITQLYWRDFYMILLYHYPNNLHSPMKPKYSKIQWKNNLTWFKLWCTGRTGYPIVDAAMRELNTTGFMHNRCRMIVSSFLVKVLQIDWQYGEKYFAQQLIDYDPANNNGGWQWSSSSGSDSQPYFRIFNPELQTKKFDPHCEYIKKWLPELQTLTATQILNWHTLHIQLQKQYNIDYYSPIVDYTIQKTSTLKMYSNI